MDFRQPAFLFLKAVFVFGRFGGRRSRRDSFLSFQSLLAEATFPSGKVIRSVTHLVPACRVRPGCQSGLLPADFGPRAAHALLPLRREPENIQCQSVFIQWSRLVARSTFRFRVQPCVDSQPGRITKISFALGHSRRGGWAGDPPGPFSSAGSGVQTPSLAPDRPPLNLVSFPARRRA
jgi:hypothetical protein